MNRRSIVNVEQLDDRLCLSSSPILTTVVEPVELRGVCHGTTVLAWARVDGPSPLSQQGNYFNGKLLRADDLRAEQTDQVFGSLPARSTVADDVIVDGRIITGENYDGIAVHGYVKIKKLNSGG